MCEFTTSPPNQPQTKVNQSKEGKGEEEGSQYSKKPLSLKKKKYEKEGRMVFPLNEYTLCGQSGSLVYDLSSQN